MSGYSLESGSQDSSNQSLVVVQNPAGSGGVNVAHNMLMVDSNTSSSNLNAGATFTGTGYATDGYGAIGVTLNTDVDCTVWIDQSPDDINWDVSDDYNYSTNEDNFAIFVEVVHHYFRVRVKNIGTSNSTHFRLMSHLHPSMTVLPQALSDEGALKTTVIGLSDVHGFHGSFSPMDDMRIAQPYRLVGTVFGSANDANFWTPTNSGTGSGVTVNNIATLTSGTSNSGYGQITSVGNARFIFAHPHLYRALVRIPTKAAALNTRRWGAFTLNGQAPQDGFFFSWDGSTQLLSVNSASGGNVTTVTSGSFNQKLKEFAMDTNVHAYEIVYFMASAHFFIDDVLVHIMTPTTAPMTGTLHLNATATSINSASGTTSGVLEMWAAIIERIGRDLTQPKSFYQAGTTTGVQLKLGPGVLHTMSLTGVANTSVVTLYDATSATNTIWSSGTMGPQTAPLSIDFNRVPFYTGLFLVISAAASNAMVVFE